MSFLYLNTKINFIRSFVNYSIPRIRNFTLSQNLDGPKKSSTAGCVKRKESPEKEIIDNEVLPLKWLLGKWAGEGKVMYPEGTVQYQEIIEFRSVGQKMLIFVSNSWNKCNMKLLHKEFGFMQQIPKSQTVYFWVSHNIGYATLEKGEQTESGEINFESTHSLRGEFAKEYTVTKIKRRLRHKPKTKHSLEKLRMILDLYTVREAIPHHLSICYDKIHPPVYIIPESIPFGHEPMVNPKNMKVP